MKADSLSISPDSSVVIHPAGWRDVGSLYRLEKACFPVDAWPIWDVLLVLTLPNIVRLKAVVGDKPIGFVVAEIKRFRKIAWIATIGVDPAYQKQGVGASLLEACERRLSVPTIRLSVRSTNDAALRMYRRFGYEFSGTWPKYYKGGEDALIMEKKVG